MGGAISVRGLWKVFGPRPDRIVGSPMADLPRRELEARTGNVAAVRDIDLDVEPGETFVVMGLSGSGKSTLVRCLTRLIEPTAGTVRIGELDVTAADEARLLDLRRHRVSMVFQHFGLLPHRDLADNVAFGLEVQGLDRAARRSTAEQFLELVGLSGLGTAKPDQLSGGMQQRVGLARALATGPEVLLFDEPFSALDPVIRRDMQDEVVRLRGETATTIVFIPPDLVAALRLGDRIAIMRDGRFVQVGTPAEVVGAPADDDVALFVRDVSRANVLPVEAVMAPLDGTADDNDDAFVAVVALGTTVRDVLGALARSDRPVGVADGEGRVVGVVDRATALRVVAGADDVRSGAKPVDPVDPVERAAAR
ncbi:MAG: quaternary amine ABC transporter ATP-binding protein [Ilumatobacteraceae bacterium]